MLQNLLSKKDKKKLKQEYFIRFSVVSALLVSGALGVGVVALIPSYVKVFEELSSQKKELAFRQESARDDKALNTEVSQSAATLTLLERELGGESITGLIDETLFRRPSGITVVGYSYDMEKRTLTLQGVASTRDLVAPYARSLEESELFEEVPVPFSDLAKNTNLEFMLAAKLKEAKKEE